MHQNCMHAGTVMHQNLIAPVIIKAIYISETVYIASNAMQLTLHACRDCDTTKLDIACYHQRHIHWECKTQQISLRFCITVHKTICIICLKCRQKARMLSRMQVSDATKVHACRDCNTKINNRRNNRSNRNCKMQQNSTSLGYSVAHNSVLQFCCITSLACSADMR